VDTDSIISILGTTPEQITVTGMLLVWMVFSIFVIRAMWKEIKRLRSMIDEIVDRYEDVAEKYDRTANKLNDSFDKIVTQMAAALFGSRRDDKNV